MVKKKIQIITIEKTEIVMDPSIAILTEMKWMLISAQTAQLTGVAMVSATVVTAAVAAAAAAK